MENKDEISWLILDWGTTNFRAFAMDDQGQVIDKIERKMGLLKVKAGGFDSYLESLLSDWLEVYQHLPVYMAGMVGSAQGWVNVPYVSTPTNVESLAKNTHQFKLPWGATATIVPGVSHCTENGSYDVMRGEEVQLFGLLELVGNSTLKAVFPGTHSKHADIKKDNLMSFSTYMTGELFSTLTTNTILGRDLPKQTDSDFAFHKGIEDSVNPSITNQLFKARTHRLFGNLAENEVHDYISGSLIGNEVRGVDHDSLYLVGEKNLSERYEQACSQLNITTQCISGDRSFIAGMIQIKETMSHDKTRF
ncbi:2-dehydro-3-deoxygalactonokinase [Vibrio ulleungensis]|uniref:2-dehydro-3-deoxygalactonokinase n=1 Tax=Vibrio ulleungensis TaxID=2807619 RepID=A0ABS2HC98_9VIBR|nr:2-dehydro-3-deoxygalactonokinase [Vibrio ulleungensis]MBM7035220.1 2-dehydro-3-deoxygalactonokinase [Vibrio ulleungensis]